MKRAIAYIIAIIILLIFTVLYGSYMPRLSVQTWESVTAQSLYPQEASK